MWLPVLLLPVIWYIPRQTAPGGLLENYLIFRWITLIIIPLVIITQFIIMRKKSLKLSNIALPLGLFVIFSLYSGFSNNIPVFEVLGSIFLYIRYPLLFIIFINMDMPKNISEVFTRLFLFLTIIQIPECLFRYLVLGIGWDSISWTLGPWGHFDLGVYMIYATALLVASDVVKGFKPVHMVLYCLFFVLALLGEIKAFVVAVPLVAILVINFAPSQRRKGKTILVISLSAFLLICFFLTFTFWGGIYPEGSNELSGNLRKIQGKNRIERISAFIYVWDYMKDDWHSLMFGRGPGSSLSGAFFGEGGEIKNIPLLHKNQVGAIFVDSGVTGMSLYLLMLLSLLFRLIKANRVIKNPELQIISSAMIGMWLFYTVLGPFYDLFWRHDSPNYIFYFFAAIIYKYLYEMNHKTPAPGLKPSPAPVYEGTG